MTSVQEALRDNPNPGRLIVLARTLDGQLTAGYALTGRSGSSRARRIEITEAGDAAVVPAGAQSHDALRHYIAATLAEVWAALDPRFLVAATVFAPLRGVRGTIRHA